MGMHRVRPLRHVPAALVALIAFVATAAGASAAPIKLRFKPKVGEERRYKLLISARVSESTEGQDGTPYETKTEVRATIEYVRKALSATDKQTKVETKLLEGVATVEFGEGKATAELPPYTEVSVVNQRGERTDTKKGGDIGGETCWDKHPYQVPDTLLPLGISCGLWTAYADTPRLPEGEIEVGDTWRDERDLPDGDKWTRTFTLEKLTTHSGHKCAMIRERWRGRYSHRGGPDGGDVPPGEEPAYEVEQTDSGERLWYYDYENSAVVYAEGSVGRELHQDNREVRRETESGMIYAPAYQSTTRSVKNTKIALVE